MTEWNEERLEELVRKMGLKRVPGQGKIPIHLSLYESGYKPLLAQIMLLDAKKWQTLGYDETDRVSVVRYLGGLGCRTDDALSEAVRWQQPLTLELTKGLVDAGARGEETLTVAARCQRSLTLELAKTLIDAGAYDKDVLSEAALYQHSLPFELAKLLVDVGCDPTAQDNDGWDALVYLAAEDSPVDPQVTDLFLSAGCRTDLTGCRFVDEKHRLRFNQILKEQWKEKQGRLVAENSPADPTYGPDWGR